MEGLPACSREIREYSIEAGIRKTGIIFKVSAGGSFSKPLKT